jgi:hypothetical protein
MRREPETLRSLATMLLMRAEVEPAVVEEAMQLFSEVCWLIESPGAMSSAENLPPIFCSPHLVALVPLQSATLAFEGWYAGRRVLGADCRAETSKVRWRAVGQ